MRSILIVFMLCLLKIIYCQVLINEIYYDHPGNDSGEEWVELYNPSSEAINLEYWRIEKGGSDFELVLILPLIIIEEGEYLLIGETNVPDTDICAELVFQNGGSATDGVRLVSRDTLWTDTILYDSPNINGLIDDTGTPGDSFAPDVSAGNSLCRMPNGIDNDLGSDWQECEDPSPGEFNAPIIDLEIKDAELNLIDGILHLYTEIHNLSTWGVDNFAGSLDIYLNNQPFESLMINGIGGESSEIYECELGEPEGVYTQTAIIINCIYDSEMANNESGCSILSGQSIVRFNELMINPLEEEQEWVELIVDNNVDNFVDNLYIIDVVGNTGAFAVSDLQTGYQVICENPELLMNAYGLVEDLLINCEQLPGLNNAGDILYLEDKWGTMLDIVEYDEEGGIIDGVSWEKIEAGSETGIWGHCIDEAGQTAGYANSITPGAINMLLEFGGIICQEEYLEHHLILKNMGVDLAEEAVLYVEWHDITEQNYDSMEEYLTINSDSLEIVINTNRPESGYYEYIYQLEVSGDSDLSNNEVITYYNQDGLGWVINEIMYHPVSGEPEWLELKRNTGYGMIENLYVLVEEDSCEIAVEGEYVIITGSETDVQFMKTKYGAELEIYSGLKRLTDTGCLIGLKDIYGNVIESFNYDPNWNQSLQGISIERVNPLLAANKDNWSRCVSDCTPGKENSIYTELPVTESKLTINPEVFCPTEGEHTVISYQNNDNLNVIRIVIYDLKGRIIRKLVEHEYQGAEGYYIWDGRNESGKVVKTGVYIVLFESSASGNINIKKKTVVVKR